jgi:adenylyl cyclase-associated protein
MVKPAPRDFIESFIGGSDYWANGIRKEYRTTNPDQMAFVDTFKQLLLELMVYVKEYHTTGVSWNPKGVDVSEYSADASTAAPAAPSVAVAAKPAAATVTAKPAAAGGAPAPALFSALNKGENITSGLKTVTKDMQTWRSEYKGGDAPAPVKAPPKVAPRVAETVKGPAKLEFEAGPSKWVVENQSSNATVTIGDKKETVYIYGCIGATIEVVGKCKSIVIDTCKKTKIHFDTAMASVEVVNCNRMDVFCREKVPAVAIDKTDGIVVHLPASSLDSSIVASKSSEMNVSFPDETGELIERPIPEQYVHKINGKSITAEVSDLYGH